MRISYFRFRDTKEFMERVERASRELKCSKSDLMREAISIYLDKLEKAETILQKAS